MAYEYLKLTMVTRNLVDMVWGDSRPRSRHFKIQVHPMVYAGEKWQNKIRALRDSLNAARCDAMIVTSLTEIAYILNLRGKGIPYLPVFKSYLLVTQREIILYVDQTKISVGVQIHLKAPCFNENCVQ